MQISKQLINALDAYLADGHIFDSGSPIPESITIEGYDKPAELHYATNYIKDDELGYAALTLTLPIEDIGDKNILNLENNKFRILDKLQDLIDQSFTETTNNDPNGWGYTFMLPHGEGYYAYFRVTIMDYYS